MSALAYDLPVTELGVMMRRLEVAMSNEEWRDCPVGREVARFIDALEWNESSPNTIRAYKQVLGLLALRHSDWGGVEEFCSAMGTEYLREFLSAEWGGCAASTKKRQVSIVHSFFGWLVDERRISYDPSRTIKGPRVDRRAKRTAYPLETLLQLVRAQDEDRDATALQILCRMGLRRAELRDLTVGEVDLIRGYIFVHGKGRKDELQPLPQAWLEETHPVNMHLRHRDAREYVIYARKRKFERMSLAGVHNWFKRCVRKAGLPESMTLHEMRHSAADELRRASGDVSLATQLMRHSSVAVTDSYLHPTKNELREALAAMDEAWEGASV